MNIYRGRSGPHMDTRSTKIVGEYPYWIDERVAELVVHFESKESPGRGTVFNLRFSTTDPAKRARVKELLDELSDIG